MVPRTLWESADVTGSEQEESRRTRKRISAPPVVLLVGILTPWWCAVDEIDAPSLNSPSLQSQPTRHSSNRS